MKNDKDLTEAEEIQKRWQEFTEEWYEKGLNNLDNHDGVVTYLEPSWNVKLTGPQEAGRGAGIPTELFKILKDDAIEVLYSIPQQIWKTQQWPQDWKRSLFISISKKGNAKQCS